MEGNTGDQEKLRLVSFFSYADHENCYLMNILEACLRWKRLEGIVSVCQPHDRGGGEKKLRVFPRKAEFGASVASSFVQPDTPHPPDGEGLGP